jgi:hypothetical protein
LEGTQYPDAGLSQNGSACGPTSVLRRQTQHQFPDLCLNRWPSGPVAGGGPSPGDQVRVPPQQHHRRHHEDIPAGPRQHPLQATNSTRSAGWKAGSAGSASEHSRQLRWLAGDRNVVHHPLAIRSKTGSQKLGLSHRGSSKRLGFSFYVIASVA